ncbi:MULTISPECIES: O-antigen ligase family protein [unclassified Imperialibacter]|uniref:O-antigen ligase family protein n=1 Tax=unclassified Imperialibacter TaxID=2629706 RepID=UPI001256086B|nr:MULTISPECIES: O-antigen ligase family protein [unclassified Imperialibacter]CAD5267915.1 conserved membrane hypothetical protein [Imperialibacter sp. 89]CAD5296372.1 conserved membrane hypothetical protein [Imperialibacter sp. 75]VVT33791.1 conserved membrane hypothetical protein [Imperialibacter sp. EC-SDR9]
MILFLLFFLAALLAIGYSSYKILFKGGSEYVIVFMCLYLPAYITILSLVYKQTGSTAAVVFFQYAKELIVLFAFLTFIFFKRDFFSWSYKLLSIDIVFMSFLLLAFTYVILPLGGAGITEKLAYFKNILMLGIMYFFGRNFSKSGRDTTIVTNVILFVAVIAFFFVAAEAAMGTHFHSFTGYAQYNKALNEIEPTGEYMLSWTFETAAGHKRYSSFFSTPLELASAVVLAFPLSLILLLNATENLSRGKYAALIVLLLITLVLTFSRASMASLFVELVFVTIIFRYYRMIFVGVGLLALAGLYFYFWAPKDTVDLIYDTVTFQEPSTLGHAIEWFEGIDSMIASPQGIGLAMSGNARGVVEGLRVGGENQFIIFGVQLGVLGLFLYCLLLFLSVWYSFKAYRLANSKEHQVIPFTAATVKVGMFLPLFTSNAEIYLYVAFVSWWMVGYSVSVYQINRRPLLQPKLNTI